MAPPELAWHRGCGRCPKSQTVPVLLPPYRYKLIVVAMQVRPWLYEQLPRKQAAALLSSEPGLSPE
jgi:hypothetical protein